MTDSVLQTNGLTKYYGRELALDHLDLNIPHGVQFILHRVYATLQILHGALQTRILLGYPRSTGQPGAAVVQVQAVKGRTEDKKQDQRPSGQNQPPRKPQLAAGPVIFGHVEEGIAAFQLHFHPEPCKQRAPGLPYRDTAAGRRRSWSRQNIPGKTDLSMRKTAGTHRAEAVKAITGP